MILAMLCSAGDRACQRRKKIGICCDGLEKIHSAADRKYPYCQKWFSLSKNFQKKQLISPPDLHTEQHSTAQHRRYRQGDSPKRRMHLFYHAALHLGNINRLATLNVETINGSDGSANCFRQVVSTEYGQHLFRLSFEKLWVEHLLQIAENCTSSHLPQYICLMNGFAEFSCVALRWRHSALNLWSLGSILTG